MGVPYLVWCHNEYGSLRPRAIAVRMTNEESTGMYEAFFNLKCRPFDQAPDPRFLYMTGQHARAVANLRFALMDHDSFVVITGEIGTGKTTALNAALAQLGP